MKIVNYFKETYNELLHKVSWPTWSELQSSAMVVMIASVIFSLLIFAMDFSFEQLIKLLYSIV